MYIIRTQVDEEKECTAVAYNKDLLLSAAAVVQYGKSVPSFDKWNKQSAFYTFS